MVGRRSFPFWGRPIFRGKPLVSESKYQPFWAPKRRDYRKVHRLPGMMGWMLQWKWHVVEEKSQPMSWWMKVVGDGMTYFLEWSEGKIVKVKENRDRRCRWCFHIFFYIHPENWGRFPIWLLSFKLGWNHQPQDVGGIIITTNISFFGPLQGYQI